MSEAKKNVPAEPDVKEEELDKVSGGVQASVIRATEVDAFGKKVKHEPEETEQQRHWRIMRENTGSSYM